jgi:hypothetical protein
MCACPVHRQSQKKSKGNTAPDGSIRAEWLRSQAKRTHKEENRPLVKKVTRSGSNDTVPDSEGSIEQFSDPVQPKVLRDRDTVCPSPQMSVC